MTNSITQNQICTKCGKDYPRTPDFFWRDKRRPGGLQSACKTCVKAYRAKNKGRLSASIRKWVVSHPDRVREHRKKYEEKQRRDHPEVRRSAAKRHREKHKEDLKRKRQERYAADPAKFAERNRRWRTAHPVHFKALLQKRRARKMNAEGIFTAEDIQKLYILQKGKCWWCLRPLKHKFDIDHRVPLSRGGSNWPSNLVLSCKKCNCSKHNSLPEEFAGRLL